MNKSILVLLFLSHLVYADVPTLIFTYVYNRPDFVELHIRTFAAFFKSPYEYIVFNDAPNAEMSNKIEEVCSRYKVRCFRVPPHHPHRQTASYRHMDGIRYSLETLGFDHNGIVMMVDADMFLIRPFSVAEYMKGSDFVGGYQGRFLNGKGVSIQESDFVQGLSFSEGNKIVYTSPCLVFMNMGNLPNKRTLNFDGDRVEGVACDVGGHTYYYFRDNSEVKSRFYTAVTQSVLRTFSKPLREYGFDQNTANLINEESNYFEYHGDTYFLHFHAGGCNWPNYSANYVQNKTNLLVRYIDQQIAYYLRK